MDLTELFEEVKQLEDSVTYDRAILQTAEDNNAKQLKVEEKYQRCIEVLQDLRSYTDSLRMLHSIVNKKITDFTNGRQRLIEQTVEDNLRYIFPEENFKVKLNLDVSKTGKETCQLLLGKEFGGQIISYSPTNAQNGRFVRQLISLVVVYTINLLRGSDMIYMDEALASSDKNNLTKLEPLLDRMIESNMQVILIEHKPELYENIERRHFVLNKERVTGVTSIVSQKDIRRVQDESDS